ncbi:MAG: enoyl-CoA hydratase/isomerase family protein [Deltaproteobacteria bacterium]|nr:enoyl-CoA hydratase/isomerase family protein [Deltaproteobacteria bacterium]
MKQPVNLENRGGTALLTLNRPEAYNAFDLNMVRLVAEILITVAVDPDVKGVVISGHGKAFCAGGDLRWINQCGERHGPAFHELAARYHQAILEIRRMPKPVVAAINGLAAGGGFSLALACDFRIMESSAILKQAYTSNGLSIDGGGTYTLPRLVGMAKALEIATFDLPIDAESALSWGLVTEVVDDGSGHNRAVEMIGEIRKRALSSFAASKKLLTDSFNTSLETQLEKERHLLAWAADQPAGREGIAAFLEKRKPVFAPES